MVCAPLRIESSAILEVLCFPLSLGFWGLHTDHRGNYRICSDSVSGVFPEFLGFLAETGFSRILRLMFEPPSFLGFASLLSRDRAGVKLFVVFFPAHLHVKKRKNT